MTLSGITKGKFLTPMRSKADTPGRWLSGTVHLQAVIQGPQFPFGSTIQKHISVIQPAVLREEHIEDLISHAFLSQLGGAHIPLVTGFQGKEAREWNTLRASIE